MILRTLALLLVSGSAFAQEANKLSAAEKAAGWKLLFDGKSFNNWRNPLKESPPSDSWSIDAGSIRANKNPKIREDLVSKENYRDFELAFDWRISEG